jgi:predicted Fe-S protein YdhL (DUF1289 family)
LSVPVPAPQPPVPTPCIGVCRLDEASGQCLGCARTGEEIAAWAEAGGAYKQAVWQALPLRRERLGLSVYRLHWLPAQIGAFAEATLRKRSGRWRLGVEGASVGFAPRPGEPVSIVAGADAVSAIGEHGALHLLKHEKTIAFAFGAADHPQGPRAIGLLLPKGRVRLRERDGPDQHALVPLCRAMPLATIAGDRDLGFLFAIRSADAQLRAQFEAVEPNSRDVLNTAGEALRKRRGHAVVETGLGRAESFGNGEGRDIDLHAERLNARSALPSGWAVDRVFSVGALFFPDPRRPIPELESEHL